MDDGTVGQEFARAGAGGQANLRDPMGSQALELAGIDHPVTVGILPDAELVPVVVESIEDPVLVRVMEDAEAIEIGLAGRHEGDLADIGQPAVAVPVVHQDAVIGTGPGHGVSEAIAIMVKPGRGCAELVDLDAIAVKVDDDRREGSGRDPFFLVLVIPPERERSVAIDPHLLARFRVLGVPN